MRYADAFHGIHFALLDIATASSGTVDSHSISRSDDGDHSTELELVLKVIDHAGKLVLNRKFDLHRNNFESSRASESLRRQLMEEYNSHLNARSNWLSHVSVEIIPYWGHLSMWRRILTNACAAFAILTIVIMPLLALLWFILAGLYYLLYEKEFRRRDNLMKLHQQ